MLCTEPIRDLIRDRNRVADIKDYIEEARDQYGMQSFDQHLIDLVDSDIVAYETAMAASSNPSDFEPKLQMLQRKPKAGTKKRNKPKKSKEAKEPPDAEASEELPDGLANGSGDVEG